MKSITILLDNISKIQAFNKASMKFPGEHLDMISGRFRIDAKSLMGIFSLDVTKPTILEFDDDYEDDVNTLFASFIYTENPTNN